MTESKLRKFLSKPVQSPVGEQRQRPALLGDSKGCCIKKVLKYESEADFLWWSEGGAKVEASTQWLKRNIARKIINHGDVWVYVWLGTCNLTTKGKKYISLTSETEEEVCNIEKKLKEIVKIVQKYPGSKVTILETPIYSIVKWNREKGHKDPDTFAEQDQKLQNQIVLLNNKIRQINHNLGVHSPQFSCDLYKTSNYKKGKKRETASRQYYNFDLLEDGIHPNYLLYLHSLRRFSS